MNIKSIAKQHPSGEIVGDNIILKKHQIETAEVMFNLVDKDRKRLQEFLPWVEATTSISDVIEYIKGCLERWEKYEEFTYSMFRKNDQQYMGNVGIHAIRWNHNKCEMGYWIGSEFEGKGFVREATYLLEQTMFNLGFNRIVIKCSTRNLRSVAIPIRLEYRLEGVAYQDVIENDRYDDTMCFAKVKSLLKEN
ncbi:MAG: GNAT family N-acetyltransferase [Oligoflexia bacterium]|nr:GNAT family N-acetyltransferase [Oligoflexia bacterium]